MGYSLLLIDDEQNFCKSLQYLFEAEGYSLEVANSGKEGFYYLNNYTFDAVIVDLGLPDIYGLELAGHAVKKFPDSVVIILTGSATIDNAVEALRHGIYDFLQKPCSPDSLLRTIDRGIEHKKLELDLRTADKRFRQLSQATWEGIIIYDKGTLLHANNQLCEMFGYQEQELLGKQIFDVLLDRNSIQTLNLQTDPETIGPFKARGQKKNRPDFPVEIRVKHIDYLGQQVQVAAIRDVTASEIATEQKLILQEQLADAKRIESLGLMAGSVAHDLNNILAGIISYPELLLLDLDPGFKYREEIALIRDAGKRAAAVVDDLLTVARGATCKKEVQNVNVIISSYLQSAEYLNIKQRFPDITVNSYLEGKLLNISCSAMHVSKTVMNLLNNAAEAIQAEGTITVSTKNITFTTPYEGYETIAPGEYVVVNIEDNGSGIDEEDLEKIFSPFYSKKFMGRSGTGLGLSVVWNTVHDHGGYVDLVTDWNGTLFSLYFPATRINSFSRCRPETSVDYTGNGEKILVVDDQKSQREIATRLLFKMGYQPHSVPSGEKAIEFIKQQQVDLILLDMLMDPGINGCETYRLILQHKPEQKTIITSGYSSGDNVEQVKKMGIKQFVKKPYSFDELGLALQQELSNPSLAQ